MLFLLLLFVWFIFICSDGMPSSSDVALQNGVHSSHGGRYFLFWLTYTMRPNVMMKCLLGVSMFKEQTLNMWFTSQHAVQFYLYERSNFKHSQIRWMFLKSWMCISFTVIYCIMGMKPSSFHYTVLHLFSATLIYVQLICGRTCMCVYTICPCVLITNVDWCGQDARSRPHAGQADLFIHH